VPRLALPLALAATLALATEARAHRLEGEYTVLPDRKVRVEAWFETGDPPQGARVRVYRADGKPLFAEPGAMDSEGVYVFRYDRAEPLKVVIATAGHRKELSIPASALTAAPRAAAPAADSRPPSPREHEYEFPFRDLLLGVTFLLALAAFVLSLRNLQRPRDPTRR
jgi:hypothetical protein